MAEGSARILGAVAKAYTRERGPRKTMHVICCEKNRHNFALLQKAVQRFAPHITAVGPSTQNTVRADDLMSERVI
jgi:mannitol-1-phosphate/altronate dehydrogenase